MGYLGGVHWCFHCPGDVHCPAQIPKPSRGGGGGSGIPSMPRWGGTSQLGGGDTRVPPRRDNVYRVSLEPSGAAEMRYHRVSAGGLRGFWGCQGDLGGSQGSLRGCCCLLPVPTLVSPLQKLTWRSNQHDISICRMKGKHEVQAGGARGPWGPPGGD